MGVCCKIYTYCIILNDMIYGFKYNIKYKIFEFCKNADGVKWLRKYPPLRMFNIVVQIITIVPPQRTFPKPYRFF